METCCEDGCDRPARDGDKRCVYHAAADQHEAYGWLEWCEGAGKTALKVLPVVATAALSIVAMAASSNRKD